MVTFSASLTFTFCPLSILMATSIHTLLTGCGEKHGRTMTTLPVAASMRTETLDFTLEGQEAVGTSVTKLIADLRHTRNRKYLPLKITLKLKVRLCGGIRSSRSIVMARLVAAYFTYDLIIPAFTAKPNFCLPWNFFIVMAYPMGIH